MKEIVLKGEKYFYVTKNEEVPLTLDEHGITWFIGGMANFMRDYIAHSLDVRALVVPAYSQSAYIEYAYWPLQDVDLDELDERITQGKSDSIEAYFQKVVFSSYQITRCNDGCKTRFHTLKLTLTTSLPREFSSIALKEGHIRILNCPHCGKSFRQQVIRIFGEDLIT